MARKRGEYQRRKERENKCATIFAVFMWVLLAFTLTWLIVECAVTINQINENSLNEYTGPYTYEVRRGSRNGSGYYLFTLDNGDILTIEKYSCENPEILDECETLAFKYSDIPELNLFRKSYTAVAIETIGGEKEVRNIEKSYRECVAVVCLCSLLLVFWFFLLGFFVRLAYFTGDWKKRYLQWQQKRKNRTN